MAQSAHVIAVGLDGALNRAIEAWFDQFNHLPPLGLTSAKVTIMPPREASFSGLLKTMAASAQTNFILVIHGHQDGSGLYLKLTPNQTRPHTNYHDLGRLVQLDQGGPELDKRDRAAMGVSQRETHELLALRRKVLAKKINLVEFRACNLGRNPVSLDAFRRFFGARRAGAPDIHSFFGVVPAVADSTLLDTHERAHTGHPWETYKFPSAFKSPEVVACFELNRLQKPEYGGHIAAKDGPALAAWIRQHIARAGGRARQDMAMHGLWVSDIAIAPTRRGEKTRYVPAAIDIDSEQAASPLGGWGGPIVRRFIPPLSELYRKHIVYAG